MFIVIATISILAITGLVRLLNRILPFKICPICAGVAGTWLWMLTAKFLGYEIDPVIPAMLMGGSVVGIAYQIEKRPAFAKASAGKLLLWKTLFIPMGFIAVYSAVLSWWLVFIATVTILIILTLKFKEVVAPSGRASLHEMRREELEKKMEDCC
ncbi:MAG: hypothetical protein HY456_00315 [Parcubacteria group bacterium]|nr:hypothetical protein [Parcubacteria group bacterium]